MRRAEFGPGVADELVRRYLDGEFVRDIVSDFRGRGVGLTPRQAYGILKERETPLFQGERRKEQFVLQAKEQVATQIENLGDLARRHAGGETLVDLAAEAGVSRSTLRNRLIEAGLYAERPSRPWHSLDRDELEEEVVRLYSDRGTLGAVIESLGQEGVVGISLATVRDMLKSHGVDLRRSGPRVEQVPRLHELGKRWAVDGEDLKILAEEAHMKPDALYRQLHNAGYGTGNRPRKKIRQVEDLKALALRHIENREPMSRLAKEAGVAPTTLKTHMIEAGYLPRTGRVRGEIQNPEALLERYRNGEALERLAEEIRVGVKILEERLKEVDQGFEARD